MASHLHATPGLESVHIPNSTFAKAVTELVRDTETELLFNHSSRVFYFAALAGLRRGLQFDRELLYAATMFHDLGLMPRFSSPSDRFEVDGANAARDFLQQHRVDPTDIAHVWTAIALHTTPGIPQYMHPLVALVTAGVEMDVLGIDYANFVELETVAVVRMFPRNAHFKEDIIEAFYEGIKHKPDSTFGNVKADVFAYKDPSFKRLDFCSFIKNSAWQNS
jgi:hypothetical protein